jgi:hypothetical protein
MNEYTIKTKAEIILGEKGKNDNVIIPIGSIITAYTVPNGEVTYGEYQGHSFVLSEELFNYIA